MTERRPLRPPPIMIPPRTQTRPYSSYPPRQNIRVPINVYQGTPSPEIDPSMLCPICTNLYDDGIHKKSMMYNCSHVMCRDCILRVIDTYRAQRVCTQDYNLVSRTPLCPLCRTEFQGVETEQEGMPIFSFSSVKRRSKKKSKKRSKKSKKGKRRSNKRNK